MFCDSSSLGLSHLVLGQDAVPDRLLLQWHITERCNLRCSHCYQESYNSPELPATEWLDILDQYESLLNAMGTRGKHARTRGHITLTGGEPFVHRDFMKLLEVVAARRDRWSFAILSNGTLVDEALARRLAALRPGFVQISIDGAPERHDEIRGAGQHDASVAAVKRMLKAGLTVDLAFTASAENYREIGAVARLGVALGVRKVWADRLVPTGQGEALTAMSREQTQEFMELLLQQRKVHQRSRTDIAMHRALQFLAAGGNPYQCTAGRTLLTIMPNGDLMPCRRMPIVVGNVKKSSLTDLYFENGTLRELRDPESIPEGCSHCFYKKLCRGGLRCLSYAVTGNPLAPDPGCSRADHTVDVKRHELLGAK